jgi:hypothetical protein
VAQADSVLAGIAWEQDLVPLTLIVLILQIVVFNHKARVLILPVFQPIKLMALVVESLEHVLAVFALKILAITSTVVQVNVSFIIALTGNV